MMCIERIWLYFSAEFRRNSARKSGHHPHGVVPLLESGIAGIRRLHLRGLHAEPHLRVFTFINEFQLITKQLNSVDCRLIGGFSWRGGR